MTIACGSIQRVDRSREFPGRKFRGKFRGLFRGFRGRGHFRGFSLIEVLLAMAIFAIGFAAVAAIFPASAVMQRNTVDDVLAQQAVDSAKAMIKAKPFMHSDGSSGLNDRMPEDLRVRPLTVDKDGALIPLYDFWGLSDRSYPSTVADARERSVYWVPLVQRMKDPAESGDDWRVFVFVLKKEWDREYSSVGETTSQTADPALAWANYGDPASAPGVAKMEPVAVDGSRFSFANRRWQSTPAEDPDQVRVGDMVLDSNGIVYKAIRADAGGIEVEGEILTVPETPVWLWYSPPLSPDRASPTRRIIVLTDVVR